MYTSNDNNRTYPRITNDLNEDINLEKFFDTCFSIYNNDVGTKKHSKIRSIETTNYNRDNFISILENNIIFQSNNGNISAKKLRNYTANILFHHFHPHLTMTPDILLNEDVQKELAAAAKIIIEISRDKNSKMKNSQDFKTRKSDNDKNRYVVNPVNTNVEKEDSNRQIQYRPMRNGRFVSPAPSIDHTPTTNKDLNSKNIQKKKFDDNDYIDK